MTDVRFLQCWVGIAISKFGLVETALAQGDYDDAAWYIDKFHEEIDDLKSHKGAAPDD